jgi:hypothetical protein
MAPSYPGTRPNQPLLGPIERHEARIFWTSRVSATSTFQSCGSSSNFVRAEPPDSRDAPVGGGRYGGGDGCRAGDHRMGLVQGEVTMLSVRIAR